MTTHLPIQGYRLSPQQADLWLVQQGGPSQTFYAQCALLLEGDVNAELLRAALADLVERHEILRTTFQRLPGMSLPLQVVGDADASWGHDEESVGWEPEGGRDEIIQLLDELRREPSDFERGPLLRTKLLISPARKHLLLLSVPSVCADARGLDNLVQDLARCYAARALDEAPPEPPVQYADVSGILNDFLEAEEVKTGRDYWRQQKLSGLTILRLPFEGRAAAGAKSEARVLSRQVAPETAARIDECALAHGASAPAFLLSCWQVLLGRLTMQTEVAVGVLAACRTYDEFQEAAGLFAKYLPVRCRAEEDTPFAVLLAQVEAAMDEACQWQDYFSWGHVAGDDVTGGERVFLPFGFEVEGGADAFPAGPLTLSVIERRASISRFKIKLACRLGDGLRVQLHFDPNSYRAEDVERLAGQYETLLQSALANAGQAIGELEITGAAERQQVVEQLNGASEEYPSQCLHEPFERQAARTPDRVALTCSSLQLTYSELDAQADALASELRRRGVGPDVVVGLLCERSEALVVGLLGILKAGGAYLPLDPEYPEARLRLMAEQAGARLAVVVTAEDGRLADALGLAAVPSRAAQAGGSEGADAASSLSTTASPAGWRPARPSNLAYVIYTSGSTGSPKGVMVSHAAICNRLEWMRRRFPIGAGSRLLQKTPASFDASVWELLLPLWSGARLVVAEAGAHRDARALAGAVRRHEVDTLQVVPTVLEAVTAEAAQAGDCASLRRVFSGGEALGRGAAGRARRAWPGAEVVNLYGPTEVSIDATFHVCTDEDLSEAEVAGPTGTVPIGRPIGNARAYVRGRGGRASGVWEPGLLAVGGAGLARGYVGRPDLTAERFVPDPAGVEAGGRLYETGDVCVVRGDGAAEYVGRGDGQVKVRGCRVELGEVERAVAAVPGVHAAAVTVAGGGDGAARLVAFVVASNPDEDLSSLRDELRRRLAERLPEYMVPSGFVFLDELPLLPSGKLDRNSLPELESKGADTQASYVAPRTPLEERLAEVWAELLGVERVSVRDNFFELGGHSLMATELISRIREDLQVELPLKVLFRGAQTVEVLAAEIENYMIDYASDGDIAAALEEFDQLSEEEVRALLAIEASLEPSLEEN